MKMLLNGKKVGTEGREEIIVINPYTRQCAVRRPERYRYSSGMRPGRRGEVGKSACAGTGQDPGESFF